MIKNMVLLICVVIMPGCATGYVMDAHIEEGDRYCGMIANVSQLLDIYVKEKDTSRSASVLIPDSPVKVDVDLDTNRSIQLLAEQMTNDVAAIRSVLFTIVVLRNMAPCDEDNVKLSWMAVNNAINALERHYGKGEHIGNE